MNIRYEREKPTPLPVSHNTKLIWVSQETETYYDTPKNSYCLFRKTITVEKTVEKATLNMFADSRYVVYLNGKRIGRGPCGSDPRWQYVDTYDVTRYLVKGENVFAAEVLYYGYGTGHSICRIPALFAECTITFENQTSVTVSTDHSWKTCLSDGLNRRAPRVNGCKGCIEVWNMQNIPDFSSLDFDDSAWSHASVRDVNYSPFWNLYPKPIENLQEDYVKSDAVIARGIGKAEITSPIDHIHKQIKAEIDNLALPAFSKNNNRTYEKVEKETFNYAVIDFKKVLAGYISLHLKGNKGDIVDIVYSEELLNGKPVFDNVSYRPFTRFVLKDGENTLETKFNYEAFRYVYVFFRNYVGDIELNDVGIITRTYPADEVSSFETDNHILQKIWDISTHTLTLSMQDGFLDSPSREQQQWMGDGRFQAIMNYYYSGDCRMHEKLLLQIAQSQDFEGMTCSRYPDANHNWPPIPSFCLQWICSFGDYYAFTRKTALISSLWNSVIAAMRWFSGFENAVGLLEDVPYWQYYDISKDDVGKSFDFSVGRVNAFINLMYAEAMNTVVDLARVLGDCETETFFQAKLKKLKNGIVTEFWNEEYGLYSAYNDRVVVTEAINALALIVLHHKDDPKASKIVNTVFDANSRLPEVFKVSPYFMVSFYRAMRKMGRTDIAVFETLQRYSLMIESGATSTWEHWELTEKDNRHFMHSACHAWAAAPIVLIAETLLNANKSKEESQLVLAHFGNFKAKIVTPYEIYKIKVEDL